MLLLSKHSIHLFQTFSTQRNNKITTTLTKTRDYYASIQPKSKTETPKEIDFLHGSYTHRSTRFRFKRDMNTILECATYPRENLQQIKIQVQNERKRPRIRLK